MYRSFVIVLTAVTVLLAGCKKASPEEVRFLAETTQIDCASLTPCKFSVVDLETGKVQIEDRRMVDNHYRETTFRTTLGPDSSIVTEGFRIGCHQSSKCEFFRLSRDPVEVFMTNRANWSGSVAERTATISFR